ncbi:helix-turn-helix transcriptional regulator [Vagococcus zengguangii]|uniref:Uncharacterized protein n=1 Tax=Vagococcus zengguangii TaxID=2571750 RepID=A0A4D7CSP5_9ENTE|nr:PAS domain-containing protein [Vagococcus zengguangii]QCI85577.1 hypothetical protein FA707_00705 [Vagococcus zengguangii]TLG79432.1 hypothetical protein FE258_08780 [Vagococcus zengguangii]
MKQETLHFYQSLTKFLGKALGENFEVILHVLEKDNYHIAAIENNHISGRTLNSPVTGFALELIQSNHHLTQEFIVNYKSQTINGHELRGATFFIKGSNNQLEGLLCINQDVSKYEQLATNILSLVGLTQTSPVHFNEEQPLDTVEVLEESLEDIIKTTISWELIHPTHPLNKEQKLTIIRDLNDKGVFQVKGAVARVAEIFHISEPSIYRYLKIVNHK